MVKTAALLLALSGLGVAVTVSATEQQVQFLGSSGVQIAGTLSFPQTATPDHPVPALLLIQGSGPTDRDGNQLPNLRSDLLRQLAETLADEGIASLRYDKRGMNANKESMPLRREDFSSFFTWSAFVGDAQAALTFLASQPTVIPDRVGIIGHSEGGLIALDSVAGDQPQPKLLILASTPGRPIGQVIHDQLLRLLDRQKATETERQFFLAADLRIQAEIRATGKVPLDVPAGLAALYPGYLGPFYRDELALDPMALAMGCKAPILVINGGGDTQVSATEDAAQFSLALKQRGDGSAVFTPEGVSHNLKLVAGDQPGIAGPLAPSVRDKLIRWLKSTL